MYSVMIRFLICLLLSLTVIGCNSSKSDQGKGDSRSFPASGIIEKISPDRHVVTIHHKAIPGYMAEMTMDFPVHDENLMDGLTPGDQIDFTLVVASQDAWVESVHRTGHVNPAASNGMTMTAGMISKFKPGDLIPDGEFVGEDGKKIHLSDFRGKAVAFTFFLTRCPLPTYCPLMNRNFSSARKLLLANPKAPKNWQFLSISFDLDFDTPETLSSYGDFYRDHNKDRWLFVASTPDSLSHFAAPLGLMVMRQDNNISHNLRTVVVDTQGRLYRQFNDNLWTPQELANTILKAIGGE
jgi:protein SCO1/2